jgi:hypothetical protein
MMTSEKRDAALGMLAAKVGQLVEIMDKAMDRANDAPDHSQEVIDVIVRQIKDTRVIALGMLTIAKEVQDPMYLTYLVNNLKELTSGPEAVRNANERTAIMDTLSKMGIDSIIKAARVDSDGDNCDCPICQLRRSKEAGKKAN